MPVQNWFYARSGRWDMTAAPSLGIALTSIRAKHKV